MIALLYKRSFNKKRSAFRMFRFLASVYKYIKTPHGVVNFLKHNFKCYTIVMNLESVRK